MVVRGDLGVELVFERLAEVEEEILWLCEAAHAETEKKRGRCESDPAFLLMAAVRTAGYFGYSNPWVWKT